MRIINYHIIAYLLDYGYALFNRFVFCFSIKMEGC